MTPQIIIILCGASLIGTAWMTNERKGGNIIRTVLFFIVVIAFYAISIWQYRNPTEAIRL